MGRESVTHARLRNTFGEQREIGRMKHAVADAGHHGRHKQCRETRCDRQENTGNRQQTDARAQDAVRAELVHPNAGNGLPDTGDNKKHRHQRAHFGKAQAEIAHDPREQRREHQVKEMRGAVRETDQRNNAGVRSETGGGVGRCSRHPWSLPERMTYVLPASAKFVYLQNLLLTHADFWR